MWTDELSDFSRQIILTAIKYRVVLEQNESSKHRTRQYWNEFQQVARDLSGKQTE